MVVSCYGLRVLLVSWVFTVWIVEEFLFTGISPGSLGLEHFSWVFSVSSILTVLTVLYVLGVLSVFKWFHLVLSLSVAFIFDGFKLVHRFLLNASWLNRFLSVFFEAGLQRGWVRPLLHSLLSLNRRSHRVLQRSCILSLLGLWCRGFRCGWLCLTCDLALAPFEIWSFFDCLFLLSLFRFIVTNGSFRRLIFFLLPLRSLNLRLSFRHGCWFSLHSVWPYRCVFIKNLRATWIALLPTRLLCLFKRLCIVFVLLLLASLRRDIDRPFAL